jgi:glucose-6-phosphate dehydrogenase assembly protein OpcA
VTTEVLSRIATVVVIGEPERLNEGAAALEQTGDTAAVRAILISTGDDPAPAIRRSEHATIIDGLQPQFVNNAVAALRLSSLPTLVWWRGGDPHRLSGLAALADRLVLDAVDPYPAWSEAVSLFERTAISDLRWTRLTRWRALMANFFDSEDVRNRTFSRLFVEGSDAASARLFAGWMQASLSADMPLEHRRLDGPPVRSICLSDSARELGLKLSGTGTCVEAAARTGERAESLRMVTLGDQSLPALIAEELRVRARDHAFERAVTKALESAR